MALREITARPPIRQRSCEQLRRDHLATALSLRYWSTPLASTAIAFAVGIALISFAVETRGETLPEVKEARLGELGALHPSVM